MPIRDEHGAPYLHSSTNPIPHFSYTHLPFPLGQPRSFRLVERTCLRTAVHPPPLDRLPHLDGGLEAVPATQQQVRSPDYIVISLSQFVYCLASLSSCQVDAGNVPRRMDGLLLASFLLFTPLAPAMLYVYARQYTKRALCIGPLRRGLGHDQSGLLDFYVMVTHAHICHLSIFRPSKASSVREAKPLLTEWDRRSNTATPRCRDSSN